MTIKIINKTVNLCTIPTKESGIACFLEKITWVEALFDIKEKGSMHSIPLSDCNPAAIEAAGIAIDENYVERVLRNMY